MNPPGDMDMQEMASAEDWTTSLATDARDCREDGAPDDGDAAALAICKRPALPVIAAGGC
jgi:hypothetical protein